MSCTASVASRGRSSEELVAHRRVAGFAARRPRHADPMYPVKVGPTGRYLVDQNGVPFLIAGESPAVHDRQPLRGRSRALLPNRRAHGFNTVLIDLLCAELHRLPTATTAQPSTASSPSSPRSPVPPDLVAPPSTISLNRTLPTSPVPTPSSSSPFSTASSSSSTPSRPAAGSRSCRPTVPPGHAPSASGSASATRTSPNIIWFHGNDYGPPHFDLSEENDALVTGVAFGIKDADYNHLHTVLFNTSTSLPPVLSTTTPAGSRSSI